MTFKSEPEVLGTANTWVGNGTGWLLGLSIPMILSYFGYVTVGRMWLALCRRIEKELGVPWWQWLKGRIPEENGNGKRPGVSSDGIDWNYEFQLVKEHGDQHAGLSSVLEYYTPNSSDTTPMSSLFASVARLVQAGQGTNAICDDPMKGGKHYTAYVEEWRDHYVFQFCTARIVYGDDSDVHGHPDVSYPLLVNLNQTNKVVGSTTSGR